MGVEGYTVEQVHRLGGEIKTVHVDEERSERGTGSGPTPGVDFNWKRLRGGGSVYIYIRVYAHEHRYRCNPRQLEAARERQRSGKCPRGAMVRGGNSIWHPHPRLNKAAPIRASSLSSRPPPRLSLSLTHPLCVSLCRSCVSLTLSSSYFSSTFSSFSSTVFSLRTVQIKFSSTVKQCRYPTRNNPPPPIVVSFPVS